MKTILLKFSGPMQSWGTDSNFDIRRTGYMPSRSGTVGFLAACLGIKRDNYEELKKLDEQLEFAVKTKKPGRIVYDFQTAQGYKDNGEKDEKKKYVTKRYYLEDASFIVAVGSQNSSLVDEIESALKKPYFQPYLGRRGYVPDMDYFQGAVNTFPEEALNNFDEQ